MTKLAAASLGGAAVLALLAFPDPEIGAAVAFGVLLFGLNGVLLMHWGAALLGRGAGQSNLKLRMALLTAVKLVWLCAGCWLGLVGLGLQPLAIVGGAVVALVVMTGVILRSGPGSGKRGQRTHFFLSSGGDLS